MMLCLTRGGVDARTDITPSTVVEGFLLTPDQVGVGILVEVGGDQVVGERRELFDTTDGDVFETSLFTGLGEGKVDLACKRR